MEKSLSLQEQYAPHNACFGCGPSNPKGLKIRSFPSHTSQTDHPSPESNNNQQVIAHWKPEPHHEAFPGVLNGGIIGTLLDCHSNWTAAWHLMNRLKVDTPPCTVTAEYAIKLLKPTPTDKEIELLAEVVNSDDNSAFVKAKLIADGKICAMCEGKFVAVKPGHPAYHRW